MTSLTPCFGEANYNAKNIYIYEQYMNDILEQLVKIYTPEKGYFIKETPNVVFAKFNILKDGSITNLSTDYEKISPSFSNLLIYKKRNELGNYHEQLVYYRYLTYFKAKPFPEDFGECINVSLTFTLWNEKFRKKVFHNTIEIVQYNSLKIANIRPGFEAYIDRSNDINKSKIKYPIFIPDNVKFEIIQ